MSIQILKRKEFIASPRELRFWSENRTNDQGIFRRKSFDNALMMPSHFIRNENR